MEHASPTTLRLTPAGHEAVLGHLKKEATRLSHPAYDRPSDEARREQVATAITNLSANPPKRSDAEDEDDVDDDDDEDVDDVVHEDDYDLMGNPTAAARRRRDCAMLTEPSRYRDTANRVETRRADRAPVSTDENQAREQMRRNAASEFGAPSIFRRK